MTFPLVVMACETHQRRKEGVVSKETVVLRRWGSSIQKFGFINGVDNVNWPPYRDSKSCTVIFKGSILLQCWSEKVE